MADDWDRAGGGGHQHDRRRSGGGGGGRRGGGGGFAGNKRGRQSFGEDGGGGYEDQTHRLRSLVIRLGDKSGGHLNEHIEQLAQGLRRDLSEHSELVRPALHPPLAVFSHRNSSSMNFAILSNLFAIYSRILEVLRECAAELPTKTPIYATLAGLLNKDAHEFVGELVARVHAQCLHMLVEPRERDHGRLLLRFLGALVPANVVQPASFVSMLKALVAAATSAITAGSDAMTEEGGAVGPMERLWADHLVYSSLASVAWAGSELAEGAGPDLKELMEAVDGFMAKRKRHVWPALRVFTKKEGGGAKPVEGEEPQEEVGKDLGVEGSSSDFLVELVSAMKALQAEEGAAVASVPRTHLPFESRLAAALPHTLPPSTVPPPPPPPAGGLAAKQAAAHASYPPRGGLRLITANHTDGDRPPIERFVVEEYVLDTLGFYESMRTECARILAALPLPFAYEPLLAEVLLSQLLRLPQPVYKPVYYAVVVMEICKLQPSFPRYIAGCVKTIFNQIHQVDVECRARVAEWLAHHLSNFHFMWPWDSWAAQVTSLQPNHPKRKFVQSLLERLQRASYHDRVKQSVPEALWPLLADKPEASNPYVGAGEEEQEGADEGMADQADMHKELVSLMRKKTSPEGINEWLSSTCVPRVGAEGALQVVGHTCYLVGAKSFTHMLTVTERYHVVLEGLVGGDLGREAALVQCAATVWRRCVQRTAMAIDRLMAQRLVSGRSIVEWVFKPTQVKLWTDEGVWEVIHNALGKMIGRASDELTDLQRVESHVAMIQDAEQGLADAVAMAAAAEEERPDDPKARRDAERARADKARAEADLAAARQEAFERSASAERARDDLADVLLLALRSFVDVVGAHLKGAGTEGGGGGAAAMEEGGEGAGAGQGDDWLEAALGQLRVVGRRYHAEAAPLEDRLRGEVFTAEVDPRLREAALGGMGLHL